MKKGTCTFPDKSKIEVLCDPKKSNQKEVYVEWVTKGGLKNTLFLSPENFKGKK